MDSSNNNRNSIGFITADSRNKNNLVDSRNNIMASQNNLISSQSRVSEQNLPFEYEMQINPELFSSSNKVSLKRPLRESNINHLSMMQDINSNNLLSGDFKSSTTE